MKAEKLREMLANELTVSLETAFEAVGIGETAGRAALKRKELPFRVIRIGRCLRVPSCDLSRLLLDSEKSEPEAPPPGHATATADGKGPRRENCTPLRSA